MCISFLLHCGIIVLPKSVTESRIIENYIAGELNLSTEEIQKLEGLNKDLRLFKVSGRYFTTEDKLWDVEEDTAFIILIINYYSQY